jgi:hypothetical protein
MTDRDDNTVRIEERWREKLADFLVQGHLGRSLHYLARIIDAPPSLFDEIFAEERRMAWLLRINLLIQHQRYREALAWVLYELDTNPENAAALALRMKLRRYLKLETSTRSDVRSAASEVEFDWTGVAGMRSVKAMLERDVLLPLIKTTLIAKMLSPPTNRILWTAWGGEDTSLGPRKAEQAFMEIKPSDPQADLHP